MESLSPRHNYAYAKTINDVGDKSMYMKYKSHSPCSLEELKTEICCQDCGNMHKCRILSKGEKDVKGSTTFTGFYRPNTGGFYPNGISATAKLYIDGDGVYR